MGTTLVALAAVDGDRLAVINVGDSRLYTLHDDQLQQITADHNLVAELVAEGQLSKEAAEVHPRRNILTRALGVDPDVPVDLVMVDAVPGDRFLLCSDGLPREVRDDRIAALLRRLANPAEAAKELVDEAKRQGGNDNITVVVVDVVDPDKEKSQAADTGPPSEPVPAKTPSATPARAKSSIITPRVVGFVALLVVLLGAAAAGIGWYARGGYFVGLRGSQVTIFQGRPGGLLWFRPTVKQPTSVTSATVESHNLPALTAGQTEPSLTAARQYVDNLVSEYQAAQAVLAPKPAPPKPAPPKPAPRKVVPHTGTTVAKTPTTSTTR
jgi:protein phosphatase